MYINEDSAARELFSHSRYFTLFNCRVTYFEYFESNDGDLRVRGGKK
jgi:hypothetical protein